MHKNIGFFKEEEMILQFNNKTFKELTNNSKHFAKEMFGHLNDNDVFVCEKVKDFVKPDFKITCKDETHYVSMKSGRSTTVHQKYVKTFCIFLKNQGISKRILQTILLYHYDDGTLDGSGKERFTIEKFKYLLADRIKEANEELNSNRNFVLMIIERAVLKTINPTHLNIQ